ncbi:hypothetical protein SKAU_G00189970 [Synaphobranchus kaupii]|uniref:Uncharacterized protein n=1 Tax=Synaphobranchus kaupii TaxID=118154 RepID=A0A9Q1FDV3_SYNKA|nr:hypothetical protein SKAU_G00189970 [Synaphobranchus kaupii]
MLWSVQDNSSASTTEAADWSWQERGIDLAPSPEGELQAHRDINEGKPPNIQTPEDGGEHETVSTPARVATAPRVGLSVLGVWEKRPSDESGSRREKAKCKAGVRGASSVCGQKCPVEKRMGRLGNDDDSIYVRWVVAGTSVTALINTGSTIRLIKMGLLARSTP